MTTSIVKPKRKMHPNSLANIIPAPNPIKPGEIRNPEGKSITKLARLAIDKDAICPYDAQGRPWSEVLPDAMLRQALTKVEGMTHLLDRIEGPVNKAGPVRDINVVFMIGKGYSQPDIVINPPGG